MRSVMIALTFGCFSVNVLVAVGETLDTFLGSGDRKTGEVSLAATELWCFKIDKGAEPLRISC